MSFRLAPSQLLKVWPDPVARHASASKLAVPPPEPSGFPAGSQPAYHSGRRRLSSVSNSSAIRGGKVSKY
jgi:hypothetical protein